MYYTEFKFPINRAAPIVQRSNAILVGRPPNRNGPRIYVYYSDKGGRRGIATEEQEKEIVSFTNKHYIKFRKKIVGGKLYAI